MFVPTIAPLPPAGCLLADGGRRPVLSAFRGGIGHHEFWSVKLLQEPTDYVAHSPERRGRLRNAADECSLVHAHRMREEGNPCLRTRYVEKFAG